MSLEFVQKTRRALLATSFLAPFLIAGCGTPRSAPGANDGEKAFWSGRLALQVASDPPQSFFAGFELSGDARAGRLLLFSPLGSTLAALSWSPETALLERGGERRHFDSVAALVEAATGAAFPLVALFAWLDGVNASVAGWRADLSRLADGRVTAVRSEPQPAAELKVVLEK